MPSAIDLKINTAREVVLAMERTIRIRRLYPSHHARAAEATEDLVAKFLRFFDAHTYLRLSLTDSQILLEDRVLLKNNAMEPYLPFVLWKDGLREIRFHRGISRDEVLEFLGIIGLEPKEVRELGSDYVWLLWTREFSSIDCAAVDEFDPASEAAPEDPELAQEVREAAEWIDRRTGGSGVGGVGGGGGGGTGTGRGGGGGAKGGIAGDGYDEAPPRSEFAPPPLAEEFGPEGTKAGIEESLQVDLKTIGARMRAMLDTDNVGGALNRTVEALKRVPGGMPEEEINAIATGFADYYAKRKDFCALGHMLKDLAAGASGLDEGRALAKATEGVPDATLIGEMIEFLNLRYTDDVDGLTRFLDSLGERAGRIICGVYPHIASSRTRATLAEHLVRRGLGTGDALRGLLQSGDRLLSEVLELLAVVRPADLVKDLSEFTSHPSFAVRTQTIDVLARMDGWDRTRVLLALLEDPDFRIRMHVLRALAAAKDPGTILFLMDWIARPDFAERDVEEKAATFSAFASIRGNAAIPFLERQALVKTPRRGKRLAYDTKHGAVTAIRQVASGAARAALERLARDATEPVRTYARLALRS